MDRLTVDVGSCSTAADCAGFVEKEYGPASFYSQNPAGLSVVEFARWRPSKVMGYNARVAGRVGYEFVPRISRAGWAVDINELRASASERQGRPMPEAYLTPQAWPSDSAPDCRRHGDYFHGVTSPDGRLVAYAHIAQCGDMARVNTFLGHADHNTNGVSWLLMRGWMEYHAEEIGALFGMYYAHDSGHGGGLRYFKERCGFAPAEVTWSS